MIRKKKELEIILSKLAHYKTPKVYLEQYVTPSKIAAELIWFAHMRNEIRGKTVVDLGCGVGTLAIGCALLGGRAIGVEIDEDALEIAKENAKMVGVKVKWIHADVKNFVTPCDVVIMNPPFGSKVRNIDIPFLECATRISGKIYFIHKCDEDVEKFLRSFFIQRGFYLRKIGRRKFRIPWQYKFHKKRAVEINVGLYQAYIGVP